MTLHEAIKKVLEKNERPMTAKEIAEIINSEELYTREDGNPVPSSQIDARVKNYPSLFMRIDKTVSLSEYKRFDKQQSSNFELKHIFKNIEGLLAAKIPISDIERLLITIEISIVMFKLKSDFQTQKEGFISPETFGKAVDQMRGMGLFEGFLETLEKNMPLLPMDGFIFYSGKVFDRVKDASEETYFEALNTYVKESPILLKYEISQHKTPEFVNELMVNLTKPQKGEIVYDPAAGIGDTLVQALKFENEIRVYGQELDNRISELCRLNLLLHGGFSSSLRNSNSIFEPMILESEADVIISHPPFGGILRAHSPLSFERLCNDRSLHTLFFELMLSRLNKQSGRMAILLPDSFLWKRTTKPLRKVITESDMLEAIVSIPIGSFLPYSGVSAKLLVINKRETKHQKGNIIFIQSDSITNKNINEKKLIYNILNVYSDWVQEGAEFKPSANEVMSNVVTIEKIIDEDYDLTFEKFLFGVDKIRFESWHNDEVFKMKDILNTAKNVRSGFVKEKLKLVQIKDLNDKKTEFYLNQNKLQITDNLRLNYKVLNNSALLVARIGEKLKPTYFKYEGDAIAVINSIFAFEVNTEVVNAEYLISELNSDAVTVQLQLSRPWTGVIPKTHIKTFLGLNVPVPSKIEQIKRLAIYKKKYGSESELIQFINEIKLVTTPNEIKVEIERFAKKVFLKSEFINFRTEFDFDAEKFPFTHKDIEETRFIKKPQGSQNRWFTHLLLTGENNKINGVLTVESSDDITLKQYYEINAYANFIIQASSKYIQQNTNKLLNEFNHTTKNILKDIDKILNDFLETKNEKLVTSLKENYLKEEKLISHLIKNSDRKRDDFIAFNRLEDAHNIVNRHFEFFKRRHQYYTNSVNSEFEIIKLQDFIKKNLDNRNNVIISQNDDGNDSIYIKCAPIELAFNDLIENALSYSSDGKLKINVISKDHYIEFQLVNKVQDVLSKANYMNLGKEDVKKSDGTYSTGLSNAYRALKEDNEISLAPYEYYQKSKSFKVSIKLKKP